MAYTNPKELLVAVEAKLPAGAPALSGMLPDLPDFPTPLPELPALPELPELPGGELGKRRPVSGVTVTPVTRREVIPVTPARVVSNPVRVEPSPPNRLAPEEVITRRGM